MRELGSYFLSNHMIVLVMGILLLFWVSGIKLSSLEKRLLTLTAAMMALVLFPVSAEALKLYQTRFYAYHWIWSLVPVTLCIAWGATAALWKITAQKRQDGRAGLRLAAGTVVLTALLLLTGNMGNIRGVTEEEKDRQREIRQTVAYLEEVPGAEDTLLWAPRAVLEEVRRQTGKICLLYGRNMWEPEAAAYAYDTCPIEQQRLFDWMEAAEREDGGAAPQGLTAFLEAMVTYPAGNTEEQNRVVSDAYILQLAAEYDARMWVFPRESEGRVASACALLYEEYGLRARRLGESGDYVIWCCQ